MTRKERPTSVAPGMLRAGRGSSIKEEPSPGVRGARGGRPCQGRSRLWAWAIAATAVVLLTAPVSARAQGDRFPEGTIGAIQFEGNVSITVEKMKAKLLSRAGQKLDQDKVETDLKSLMGTKWFSDVTYYYEESPPKSGKYNLIFRVREMPTIKKVEFKGRRAIKLKELEDTTGLKAGNRADPNHTRVAIGQILRLYQEKGYEQASVKLIKGGEAGDVEIVIEIFEGPKEDLASIDFKGNVFATDATLRTKITCRVPILGFLGRYQREMLDEDRQKLIDYYYSHGFFEVKVTPVTRPADLSGKIALTFVVSEGTQYKVRNIVLEGNTKIKTAKLMEGLELHSGKPFMMGVRDADKERMLIKYNELGYIKASIMCEPRFTNQLGVVDLVYQIEEHEPYRMGELRIEGNNRTRDKVIRREAVQAGLLPGEVLDKNRIEIFRRRLTALGYFMNDPQQGKQIDIKIVGERPSNKPYGDLMAPLLGEATQARMQDPGGGDLAPAPAQGPQSPAGTTAEPGGGAFGPFNGTPFSPPANAAPAVNVPLPSAPALPPGAVAPGDSGPPPVGSGEPVGSFPSIPGMNMTDVTPDRNDPFTNRSFADVIASVEEAPTGKFMIGVGANSFQGLMANVMITEKNFNIFNFPRSFSDITNGMAFRGGGQEFRIMVQAGNWMNFMQVSLREPYLFDLPIGAGATGYLMSRIYPNWDERRGGGRFSIGKQLGTSMYTDFAVRAEEVDFFGYQSPAPADYLAASGYTSLFSLRPSLRFDNRNNPYMPTKGQYLEIASEQGFGSFTWSKFDAEARVYLPTGSRPDGSGKRYFTLRGHYGVTTESTPVYERYFAGNFGSMRGFEYRTVSPHSFGVPTGGVMMAVGSLEYQFPWNARDTFNQIIFTDFGTVTPNYELSQMRMSIGTGLKVVMPSFSPMPFEFDLAFPVLKAPGDRVQFFNFSIGGAW